MSEGESPLKPRPAVKVFLFVLVLAVAAGWVIFDGIGTRIRASAAVKQETLDLSVPTVATIHPKPGAPLDEVVLPGSIQAFTDAPIYARSSGYVRKWYFDIGAHVKTGQVLAEIDAPELDQQVLQAKGSVQQAQAAIEQAMANLDQGRANMEIAKLTAGRWKELSAQGVVSRQDNDQYQAQFQAQQANVQALEKAVAAARSNLTALQASLGGLEDMQRYESVKAPFDGVITARNTDVGALVNAGNGGPAQELFHMAVSGKLRVFVNVPQVYSQAAVAGVPAFLTLSEAPGRKYPGRVARTAESMDASTRTLLTEFDLENPNGELKPGAYAEVHLKLTSGTSALILPVTALIFRSNGLQVGVVRGGPGDLKAELVPITQGRDYGTEVEVTSGITAADQVIVNPPDSLVSGMTVHLAAAREYN
jgi:RND family efflux transporter MFP subunit